MKTGSKIKCPVCNSDLVHIRLFNEKIFGKKNNPYIGWICRKSTCRGWWCDCCEEFHPYGTSCATAMVRNVRGDSCLTHDPKWRHREPIQKRRKKNLKESGIIK